MTGRSLGSGRSPLETVGIAVTLVVLAGVFLLWGIGVVIGSIFGSTLLGEGEGVVAMLRSFPDVGVAWNPPIPSWLVWAGCVAALAVFGPLVWRLARRERLTEEGARWATAPELRRAGLLVSHRPLPHAVTEAPPNGK